VNCGAATAFIMSKNWRLLSMLSPVALLSLSACATYTTRQARTALPGMTVMDLQACAGIPDKKVQIGPADWLLEYRFASSATPAFEVKVLTDLDLQIGNKGGCNLTVRAREPGYVVSVHYAGDEFSTSGPQSACAPLVRECTDHADHTKLPPGYTLARWLKEPKK
jgi:hypothetical protein